MGNTALFDLQLHMVMELLVTICNKKEASQMILSSIVGLLALIFALICISKLKHIKPKTSYSVQVPSNSGPQTISFKMIGNGQTIVRGSLIIGGLSVFAGCLARFVLVLIGLGDVYFFYIVPVVAALACCLGLLQVCIRKIPTGNCTLVLWLGSNEDLPEGYVISSGWALTFPPFFSFGKDELISIYSRIQTLDTFILYSEETREDLLRGAVKSSFTSNQQTDENAIAEDKGIVPIKVFGAKVIWQVVDPCMFYRVDDAIVMGGLSGFLYDHLKSAVATTPWTEVIGRDVNTADKNKPLQFDKTFLGKIKKQVVQVCNEVAQIEGWGIRVLSIGLDKIELDDAILKAEISIGEELRQKRAQQTEAQFKLELITAYSDPLKPPSGDTLTNFMTLQESKPGVTGTITTTNLQLSSPEALQAHLLARGNALVVPQGLGDGQQNQGGGGARRGRKRQNRKTDPTVPSPPTQPKP